MSFYAEVTKITINGIPAIVHNHLIKKYLPHSDQMTDNHEYTVDDLECTPEMVNMIVSSLYNSIEYYGDDVAFTDPVMVFYAHFLDKYIDPKYYQCTDFSCALEKEIDKFCSTEEFAKTLNTFLGMEVDYQQDKPTKLRYYNDRRTLRIGKHALKIFKLLDVDIASIFCEHTGIHPMVVKVFYK